MHPHESQQGTGPSTQLAAAEELRVRIAELVAERQKQRRSRLINLVLIGFAISIPFHLAILIYLASVSFGNPKVTENEIVVDFAVLTESELENMGDSLELESLDAPEVEEVSQFSEILSDELETTAPAFASDSDLTGSIPTPGGGAGFGADDAVGGGQAGGASFFGVTSRGRRFAYIVDVSGSMDDDNKFPLAMAELKRSIAALPDYASFVVLLYSNRLRTPPFQDAWIRANPGSVLRVRRWIDSVNPGGGTEPIPAFDMVYKLSDRPDVIFFLTDGIIPSNTPEAVRTLNSKGRNAMVNTLSFGAESEVDDVPLKRIAADSDGVYRHVDPGGIRRR